MTSSTESPRTAFAGANAAAGPARLRVVASTPISEELIAEIVAAEPRIDFIRDQSLLAPQRFPGDHSGDPAFTRTSPQQAAFDALVDTAQVLYGVPDEKPTALARTVAANPGLRWVHTMPAGGGAQVKAAGPARSRTSSAISWCSSSCSMGPGCCTWPCTRDGSGSRCRPTWATAT